MLNFELLTNTIARRAGAIGTGNNILHERDGRAHIGFAYGLLMQGGISILAGPVRGP
jgi:hypothetical protein